VKKLIDMFSGDRKGLRQQLRVLLGERCSPSGYWKVHCVSVPRFPSLIHVFFDHFNVERDVGETVTVTVDERQEFPNILRAVEFILEEFAISKRNATREGIFS
jgi:hypothetical protein